MKRKIGKINRKPVVAGGKNIITRNENHTKMHLLNILRRL